MDKRTRKALMSLDIKWARNFFPEASSDEVLYAGMHKARYESLQIPVDLRHASGAWLRDRGMRRIGGHPLLPEGELPT